VPILATAYTDEAFASSFAWTMNWSLNFGPPTWDCVVVHPSVVEHTGEAHASDELVRRLVKAQDLSLIDRAAGNSETSETIVAEWFAGQLKAASSRE